MNRLVHSLSCVREAACRLQPAVSGLQYNLRFASTLKKRRRAERPAISKKGKTATSLQKGKVTQTKVSLKLTSNQYRQQFNLTNIQFKVIRRKGEYLYGAAPCLSALSMNRRKIHAIYLRSGISVKSSKRYKLQRAC